MADPVRPDFVRPPVRLDGPIHLAAADPGWSRLYLEHEQRIRSALGERAHQVEHVGSTSVPGLMAKPIIDVVLTVADPAEEAAYVPALEAAGYALHHREPEWYEHRFLRTPTREVQVHVFAVGCPEVDRMLLFRDRLRADPAERRRYEDTKRELAARSWAYVQDYADAKSAVVESILARAADTPPKAGPSGSDRPS